MKGGHSVSLLLLFCRHLFLQYSFLCFQYLQVDDNRQLHSFHGLYQCQFFETYEKVLIMMCSVIQKKMVTFINWTAFQYTEMKIYCCVQSCPKPANLACYGIPKDPATREKWLNSINSDPNFPLLSLKRQEDASVCSLHFRPSDYNYISCNNQTSKREMKPDTVPSIFPWTNDWESNFATEMEIANLNNQPDKFPVLGLPDGAVELGNVESLGITTQVFSESDSPSTTTFNGYQHFDTLRHHCLDSFVFF